jgi:hypothetical protein
MLYLGKTQREAAEAAGVTPRTLRRWRKADWWGRVQSEARDAYFDQLTGKARAKILESVEDDHWLAFKVLKETDTGDDDGLPGRDGFMSREAARRVLSELTAEEREDRARRLSRVIIQSEDDDGPIDTDLTDGNVLVLPDNGRGPDGG